MTIENKKPLGGKNYGHIPHLPGSRIGPGDHKCHEGQARIACEKKRDKHDIVIVQEKLDGSNVGVARIDGNLYPLTRAGYLATTSKYEQHHSFNDWVIQNTARFLDALMDGERLCGEWLCQAHGTRYNLKHEPFVVFDLMRGKERASYYELEERFSDKFVIPWVLNEGDSLSIESAMQYLGNNGFSGAIDRAEGCVWRVESRGVFDFIVKYVRPDKQDGIYLPEVSGKEAIWNWLPNKT